MSDVQTPSQLMGSEVLFLLPDKIHTDEKFDVRPWSTKDDSEGKRIEELARTIDRDGQQDAGIVIPGKLKDEFVIIAGHRRRRAIVLLNQQRSEAGQPLVRMRVIVDRTPGDPRRKAIVNNLHRKNNSPMELAALMEKIEKDHNWSPTDMKSHKQCAEYLGVSPAQVTQHLRLLKLDKAVQLAVHNGEISRQSAFDMVNNELNGEQQKEVIQKGREHQDTKLASESKSTEEFEKKKAAKGGKVENPSIKKAIKEVKEAKGEVAVLKKSKAEILEHFEELDGPAYGEQNSAVRVWARYVVGDWAAGKGSDKKERRLFDAMIKPIEKPPQEQTVKVVLHPTKPPVVQKTDLAKKEPVKASKKTAAVKKSK